MIRTALTVTDAHIEAFRGKFKATSVNSRRVFNTGAQNEPKLRIQTPIRIKGARNTKLPVIVHRFMDRLNRLVQVLLPSHIPRDWVVLESLPGCVEQRPHHDFNENTVLQAVHEHGESAMPYAIVFALDDGAILHFWRNESAPKDTVHLCRGDMVIFRANTIHAGAGYEHGHFARLHCYADSHFVQREINTTELVTLTSDVFANETATATSSDIIDL